MKNLNKLSNITLSYIQFFIINRLLKFYFFLNLTSYICFSFVKEKEKHVSSYLQWFVKMCDNFSSYANNMFHTLTMDTTFQVNLLRNYDTCIHRKLSFLLCYALLRRTILQLPLISQNHQNRCLHTTSVKNRNDQADLSP